MKRLPYLFLGSVLLFALFAPDVSAELINPLGKTATIPVLIGRIIRSILGISGAIALLMFVYGGFLWLISAGDANKVKKGKEVFQFAVIGLVIIFTSYTAVNFVIDALTGRA